MGWLTGWGFRKSLTIGSAAGAGTNYQICVKAYKTTGTDGTEAVGGTTAGKVYMGTNVRDDFGDVRFTASDGTTLLDYWVELLNSGTSAIFWIEVSDNLTSGNATIYVYYGKSDATSVSDIFDTGLTYADDHEDNSIDAKWTAVIDSGDTVVEASGQFRVSCNHAAWHHSRFRSTNALATLLNLRYLILADVNPDATYQAPELFHGTSTLSSANWAVFRGPNTGRIYLYTRASGVYALRWTSTNSNYVSGTWYIYEILTNGSQLTLNIVNSATLAVIETSGPWNVDDSAAQFLHVCGLGYGKTPTAVCKEEWIFQGKYVSPEPNPSTWGSEETPPSATKPSGSIVPLFGVLFD